MKWNIINNIIDVFLNTSIGETKFSPAIVLHPFIKSGIVSLNDKFVNILEDTNALEEYKKQIKVNIKDINSLFMYLGNQYYLAFINYAYLYGGFTQREAIKLILKYWTDVESVNNDANLSKEDLLSIFLNSKSIDYLSKENLKFYNSLPDEVVIYRGVYENAPEKIINGFSWTINKEIANRFANRYHNTGNIYQAIINKKDVLAVAKERNEEEIIVNYKKLQNVKKIS